MLPGGRTQFIAMRFHISDSCRRALTADGIDRTTSLMLKSFSISRYPHVKGRPFCASDRIIRAGGRDLPFFLCDLTTSRIDSPEWCIANTEVILTALALQLSIEFSVKFSGNFDRLA